MQKVERRCLQRTGRRTGRLIRWLRHRFSAGLEQKRTKATKAECFFVPFCGKRRSQSAVAAAILTLDPKLQIYSAANTTTLIWPPAANVVLESAEIVVVPWNVVPNASSPFAIGAHGPAKFFRLREVE